jgi:hypothetical protein
LPSADAIFIEKILVFIFPVFGAAVVGVVGVVVRGLDLGMQLGATN